MPSEYSVNERLSKYTRDVARDKLEEANVERAAKGKTPISRTMLYEIAVDRVPKSALVKA